MSSEGHATEIKPLKDLDSSWITHLARLHFEIFQGYPNTRIGPGYIRAFFRWFANYDPAVGYVAIIDNQLVGYVVGAPVGYQTQMNQDLLGPAALGIMSRPWVFLKGSMVTVLWAKLKGMISRAPAMEDSTFADMGQGMSLVGIGVSPQFRGKKIGQDLIGRFESESRLQGMDFMRLSVYSSNSAAIRVYQNCGWKSISPPERSVWTFVKSLR